MILRDLALLQRRADVKGSVLMKNFRIVFYKSDLGELVKLKEFFKEAEAVNDLVSDPPDEFIDMLGTFFPVHGWAEIEKRNSTIYVIFAEREEKLETVDADEFTEWLKEVSPSDFSLKPFERENL